MVWLCLLLVVPACALSALGTYLARRIGRRLNALDTPGVPGQVKAPIRRVPNIGGAGIFWPFALLVAGLLWAVHVLPRDVLGSIASELPRYLDGLSQQTPSALIVLGAAAALHIMGLLDDRRPLGAYLKLGVMLCVVTACVVLTDTRLLTLLDAHAGGAWLSVAISVLWIVIVTNAFNFLDNMDGLSGGLGVVCGSFLLLATVMQAAPQWFLAALSALLVGCLLGFLAFNFPWTRGRRASIFMGDGGSLVVGFVLGVVSVRITYTSVGVDAPASGAWYAVLAPILILAIPLYDFVSVVLIRLSQGKSPLVGDLQHFSHRLVRHGLNGRSAVLIILGCAVITGVSGLALTQARGVTAVLVVAQTLLVLSVMAMYERARQGPGENGAA